MDEKQQAALNALANTNGYVVETFQQGRQKGEQRIQLYFRSGPEGMARVRALLAFIARENYDPTATDPVQQSLLSTEVTSGR